MREYKKIKRLLKHCTIVTVTWMLVQKVIQYTVNLEIFPRVLFSRNFALAKFHENKILPKWRNHSVVY